MTREQLTTLSDVTHKELDEILKDADDLTSVFARFAFVRLVKNSIERADILEYVPGMLRIIANAIDIIIQNNTRK